MLQSDNSFSPSLYHRQVLATTRPALSYVSDRGVMGATLEA